MDKIIIKDLIDEDFVNYKTPCMFISTYLCNWKCCKENGLDISTCQNYSTVNKPNLEIKISDIYKRYINNPITKSIVIGGLEPLLQYQELCELIKYFREHDCQDDIVIYTGYYPYEVMLILEQLAPYNNLIFKFGRYIPDRPEKYDKVLGVKLASDNQYGVRMTNDKRLALEIIKDAQEKTGHCPCMIKENDNTLCCCLAFKNQQQGECHCGLWNK